MARCATCGGSDHARASSSRCPKRKKRAWEGSESNDVDKATYTVKRGLCGFLCPLLSREMNERLLGEIRRDVRDGSALYVELSLLALHLYAGEMCELSGEEFLVTYARFDGEALVAVLKGKEDTWKRRLPERAHDNVREYLRLRGNKVLYDPSLRSYLFQHLANKYATNLETNITTHAFVRIKRALMRKYASVLEKKEIHRACYERYYDGKASSGCDQVDGWFDCESGAPVTPTAERVAKNYWRFMPMFFGLQKDAWTASQLEGSGRQNRAFALIPQAKHGLKHVFYDGVALHQLLRRIDPENTPSQWPVFNVAEPSGEAGSRKYWERYFTCPTKFGYSVNTDGVSVSLTMVRTKKAVPNKAKRMKTDKDTFVYNPAKTYVAVDPGARLPIVTCRNNQTIDRWEKLTAGRVRHYTKEYVREKKRRRHTAEVDRWARGEREKLPVENTSSRTGTNPLNYVQHRLALFDRLQSAYERRSLARLRLDAYRNRQKTLHHIAETYFPDKDEVVLYGAGVGFMNKAHFRGYRKFPHDNLIALLKRKGRAVLVVDESYSTKTCYRCREPLVVSASPHRHVHCPVCRDGTRNRDANAAANILYRYTILTNNIARPLPVLGLGVA